MPTIGDLTSLIDSLKRAAVVRAARLANPSLGSGEFGASDPRDSVAAANSVMPDVRAQGLDELSRMGSSQGDDLTTSLGMLSGIGANLAAGPLGTIVKGGQKAGQYKGTAGFGGITPQKATALRNQFIQDAQEGAGHSKYWYDDASKDLHRIAGTDAPKADQLAQVMATLSSGTPVSANTMFGFKGWNQNLVGDTLNTGMYPNSMRPKLEQIFAGDTGTSGLKREPFAQGLSVDFSNMSQAEKDALRPVNDIHQASALTGQTVRRGLSPAEHQFLDNQMNAIVPELNARAQSAIDAAKANGATDAEIAKMDQPDWNNYRAQAAAWSTQRVKSGAASTFEEAAKHFGDYLNTYAGNITREWTPGMNTGHLPEMINNPAAAQSYADAMEPFVRGPQDTDKLATSMGVLGDRVYDNPGVYGAERNPGFVTPVMVGKQTGSHALDPSSLKAMEAVAAAHGLLGTQQQVAGNFLGGPSPMIKMGALAFRRDTPIAGDELKQMQDLMISHGMDPAQADVQGARSLIWGDQKDMMKKGKTIAEQFGATAEPMARDSFIFPADENFNAPATWSAQPFIDKITAGGPKMTAGFDDFARQNALPMLSTVQSKAQELGLTQAEWFRPMMEGLATGGVSRLQELVRQGIVPVSAISALGLAATQGNAGAGVQ